MSQPHIPFKWDYDQPYVADVHFRLYEDGELVVDDIGELHFDLLMEGKELKEYTYHVTAVRSEFDIESDPSNSLMVPFTKPAAPTNFRIDGEWATASVSGSVG
jgi:hypothetical protein